MEELIYLLVVVGVILSIRSHLKKFQAQRPARRDDKSSPEPPPVVIRREPPVSPLRPTLPPQLGTQNLPQLFDELLGVEREQDDERELPVIRPSVTPAPSKPLPGPPPLPPPLPVSPQRPTIRMSGAAVVPPERRRYVDEDGDETHLPVATAAAPATPTPVEWMAQSMAKAFPEMKQKEHSSRPGVRVPIPVRVGGRSGLRRAVIMAEILQRPRAYDL